MTDGGLFGHCQSNLITPHPHSPDEADQLSFRVTDMSGTYVINTSVNVSNRLDSESKDLDEG